MSYSMRDPNEELFAEFLLESSERLDRLEEVLLACAAAGIATPERLQDARMQLHTLKGNAGLVDLRELQSLAHDLEDQVDLLDPLDPQVEELLRGVDLFRELLERASQKRAAGGEDGGEVETALESVPSGVRIPFARLDGLVDLLGEMVIFRNRMDDALQRCRQAGSPSRNDAWDSLDHAHEHLGKTLDQLRDGVMRLRMVPLHTLFRRLGRIVHDEAAGHAKEVRFETAGGETPLDKALLELSSEVLGHLVRNAVVHGLESPEERRRAGKPSYGTVRLSAETDAREVWIAVSDDGGGVRHAELAAAARRRGIEPAPGQDPLALLFLPGLSTRPGADMSAGRGIGLAAVQEAVTRHGGRIEVLSEEGIGSMFRLRLPLSVSITRALLLGADGESYVLPLSSVVESVPLASERVHEMNGACVLSWRGGLVPLLDLGYSFGTAVARRRQGYAVVIESDGAHRALATDQIHGIREVVVKGLDRLVGSPPGIGGSTVLGDGRAVLILDPVGLMALSPFGRAEGRPN